MKFNSPLAEHLYGLAMESFEDDTAGGNPHTWYALFIEERAILSEDPHGFVDAVTYESEAYAKSIWSKIQDSLVWSELDGLSWQCDGLFLLINTAKHLSVVPDLERVSQHVTNCAQCESLGNFLEV